MSNSNSNLQLTSACGGRGQSNKETISDCLNVDKLSSSSATVMNNVDEDNPEIVLCHSDVVICTNVDPKKCRDFSCCLCLTADTCQNGDNNFDNDCIDETKQIHFSQSDSNGDGRNASGDENSKLASQSNEASDKIINNQRDNLCYSCVGCCTDCRNESIKVCCDDCAKGVIHEIAITHGILLQTLESAADYGEDPAWFRKHIIEISNTLNANWGGDNCELTLHRQTADLIRSIHEREQSPRPTNCCVVL